MKCDAVYKTPFWREDGLNGFGINDSGAARAVFDNSPQGRRRRACCWRSSAARPGGSTAGCRGRAAPGTCSRASPRCSASRRCTRSSTPSRTGPRSSGPPAARPPSTRPGTLTKYGSADPAAVRPGALGRHRDLDVLDRLHGRRRPLRRARRRRGAGRAAMRRLVAGPRAGAARLPPCARSRRRTARSGRPQVFATVPAPGYPGVRLRAPQRPRVRRHLHQPAGRARSASRVFEWSRRRHAAAVVDGAGPGPRRTTASRSANQTRDGKLVLLEKSTRGGADPRPSTTGPVHATVARLAQGRPVPNYAAWGPGPALYVTDYAKA